MLNNFENEKYNTYFQQAFSSALERTTIFPSLKPGKWKPPLKTPRRPWRNAKFKSTGSERQFPTPWNEDDSTTPMQLENQKWRPYLETYRFRLRRATTIQREETKAALPTSLPQQVSP